MEWFDIVAKRHNEYLKIVASFPENITRIASERKKNNEDIVQDTYIEITELGTKKHKDGDKRVNPKYKGLPTCKRILDKEGEVNIVFMWIILKRVSLAHRKKRIKKTKQFIRLGDEFEMSYNDDSENEEAFSIVMDRVENEMDTWHWYDKLLFETYVKDSRSMRGLSSDTHISLTSIFTTLKNCKERIRQSVGEDYADYMNKDYELIK